MGNRVDCRSLAGIQLVPEPGAFGLLGLYFVGLLSFRRMNRRR